MNKGSSASSHFTPQFAEVGTPGYGKAFSTQSVTRESATPGVAYLGPMNPTLQTNGNNPNRIDGSVVEWSATFGPDGEVIGLTSRRKVYRVVIPSAQHPINEAAFNPFAQPGDEDYGLLDVLHPDGSAFNQGTGLNGAVGHAQVVESFEYLQADSAEATEDLDGALAHPVFREWRRMEC